MKFSKTIALIAGLTIALSAHSASAFNKNKFGGMAKFYAHSAAVAKNKVQVKTPKYTHNGYNSKVKVKNEAEQYNESFRGKDRNRIFSGSQSGSRNNITVEWKGGTQRIDVNSKAAAKGASGFGRRPVHIGW